MEPAAPVGTHIGPLSDSCAPRTLAASMAIQCLSPTSADLPEDVIQRARSIENEQRQLIARRESSGAHAPEGDSSSPSKSAATSPNSRTNPLTPPLSTTSSSHKSSSFSLSSSPSTASGSESRPVVRSRSFGGRRSVRPRALDLNALRRERQFSGPYSANPLLPRKRTQPEEEDSAAAKSDAGGKRPQPKSLDGELRDPQPLEPEPRDATKNIRLPLISQMTTAPFVASGTGRMSDKLWPPLCTPSPHSGAPVSLPASASQMSFLTPPSATTLRSQTTADTLVLEGPGIERRTRPTRPVSQMTDSERKARYMELCSEMWDLANG